MPVTAFSPGIDGNVPERAAVRGIDTVEVPVHASDKEPVAGDGRAGYGAFAGTQGVPPDLAAGGGIQAEEVIFLLGIKVHVRPDPDVDPAAIHHW
ncbi:hypothetical protein DSECCO2_607010 [anaerobic digester metagenome]